MDKLEIKNRFREENPELTSRVIAGSVLDSWLQEGDKNFCARAGLIVGSTTFDSEIDEPEYDLTAQITSFYDIDEYPGGGVAFSDDRLDFRSISELDELRPSWRTASSGTPTDYYRRGGSIFLSPPPDSEDDIEVYAILISDDFDDDAKLPFNQLTYLEPFHYGLVLYLNWRAKGKIGKPEERNVAMAEYNEYIRWTMAELASGKYGPINFTKSGAYK